MRFGGVFTDLHFFLISRKFGHLLAWVPPIHVNGSYFSEAAAAFHVIGSSFSGAVAGNHVNGSYLSGEGARAQCLQSRSSPLTPQLLHCAATANEPVTHLSSAFPSIEQDERDPSVYFCPRSRDLRSCWRIARPASASDAQSRFRDTTVRMRASIAAALMSTSLAESVIDGASERLDVDEVFAAGRKLLHRNEAASGDHRQLTALPLQDEATRPCLTVGV